MKKIINTFSSKLSSFSFQLSTFSLFLILGGLVSCSSDNDDPDTPIIITTENIEFLAAVGPNQNLHFEQTFTFKVGPNTLIIPISEMTEVKNLVEYTEYKAFLDRQITAMQGMGFSDLGYKVYRYNLGTIQTGQSVKAMDYSYTLKENRPTGAVHCYINCPVLFKVGEPKYILNSKYGVKGGDIPDTAEGIGKICNMFYTSFMGVSYMVK